MERVTGDEDKACGTLNTQHTTSDFSRETSKIYCHCCFLVSLYAPFEDRRVTNLSISSFSEN